MVIPVAIIQILRRINTCSLAPNVISQEAYTNKKIISKSCIKIQLHIKYGYKNMNNSEC